jgi:hypothetical protein
VSGNLNDGESSSATAEWTPAADVRELKARYRKRASGAAKGRNGVLEIRITKHAKALAANFHQRILRGLRGASRSVGSQRLHWRDRALPLEIQQKAGEALTRIYRQPARRTIERRCWLVVGGRCDTQDELRRRSDGPDNGS